MTGRLADPGALARHREALAAVEAPRREVTPMVPRQGRVDLTRQDSRFRTSCGQTQSEGSVARSQLDDLPAIGVRDRSDHLGDEEPLRRHNAASLTVFCQPGPEKVQVRCETVGHEDQLWNGLVYIGEVIAKRLAEVEFGGRSWRRACGRRRSRGRN